ncbi:DEAD/DEAH box helicase [Marinobacter halodurans]|uniref:DEAD/DEAH box helicase n=1 Tax=Marinobacter halodurans TaxID=2528979 RepID=A0ABY1ZHX8_9GAMM|nr:DEAD/DEAH box helicase [Marinobacter halodurans]TBW47842.1 DEAD/DEAH box helicase [Marinobacter halodurans]
MDLSFDDLKVRLKNGVFRNQNNFEILQHISMLCNSKESIDKGRELLIRLLEHRNEFDSVLLNSMLRKTGLFPYMQLPEQGAHLDFFETLAYELHRPETEGEELVFHSLQSKVYNKLVNGENVILSAPTSFGKSILIDSLIRSGRFKKIVIILPTLALIDETRQRISEKFQNNLKVITHSSQSELESDHAINIYALTQERALELNHINKIDLLIVDEFYKVDPKFEESDERALLLNYAFHKLVKLSAQFYLLGPNIESVRGLDFYGRDYYFIPTQFTTVAADVTHYNYKKNDPRRFQKLEELVYRNSDSKIVYCQSPTSASTVAGLLAEKGGFDIGQDVEDAVAWIEANYSPYWIVAESLRAGIGIHHGGVPRAIQQWMIKAFNKGQLKVLVCTSTIIEGVNTVAKTVIMYDRRKATNILDFFSFKNILGRAGRMGEHFVGEAHILESAPEASLFDVSFPIGFPENYPRASWHLLYDDEDDRPEIPSGKFENLLNNKYLSQDFLKKNLPLDIEGQIKVAKELEVNSDYYNDSLFTGEYPNYAQKEMLFKICYLNFLNHSCQHYGVYSDSQLLHKVESIMRSSSLADYLSSRISGSSEDPSYVVENDLKFIRNIVCFSLRRFSTQLSK